MEDREDRERESRETDETGYERAVEEEREERERVEIELPPSEAVPRGGGKGVVVVVPRFAPGRERQPPDVARLVLCLESPASEEVAHRVDRPGDVVEEEDSGEAAPEESLEPGCNRASYPVADGERHEQRDRRDRPEQP